jgi:hypothetical protein
MPRTYLWLLLAAAVPRLVSAQDLTERIGKVSSGTVRMNFAARAGVCGNGENNISTQGENEEWRSGCDSGPVRVALRVENHKVHGIRTYVGGSWRQSPVALDLGTVRPQAAAGYLLGLATEPREIEGDPVLPATLADSVTTWPSLLRLARDQQAPLARRKAAVFWLSQAAEAAAGQGLDSVANDEHSEREIRKEAVFALSQRTADESVPRLIHIVKTNRDPEVRKAAIFWLGQSEDPRALELFEEILQ